MSAFTFEQQNELKNLFTRWADESTGARLIRQLQGNGVFPVPGDKRTDLVVGTVTWPGGSSQSNDITVSHGYGSTPRVLTQMLETVYVGACVSNVSNMNNATFKVNVTTIAGFQPVAGTQRAVVVLYWEP